MSKKATKKKVEITYEGKSAYKLFVNKKGEPEKENRVIWGEQGEDKHINTIIKQDGKTSTHSTNQKFPEGHPKRNTNVLPTTGPLELFKAIGQDLTKQMLGKEYKKNDLILLKKDKLQEFVNEIKDNPDKIGVVVMSKEAREKKRQEYIADPITKKELEKITEPQILTNSTNEILMSFQGKVYDVTDFSQNPFNNMLGTMMGFAGKGMPYNELSKKIAKNLEEAKANE